MKYICTYFDINFLPRGLALYHSIKKFEKDFLFYVLCLDNDTELALINLNFENIVVLNLNYIEQSEVVKNLSEKELYFSITPSFCQKVLINENISHILYLDADIYFFNDINILYNEIGDVSIAFCDQRLNKLVKFFTKNYGYYNVGINYFKSDREGFECLKEWERQCVEWTPSCDTGLNFFSDQIYLDNWPLKFNSIKIITHKGINTAPWNSINYKFSYIGGQYFVDNLPLVAYHFSSLSKVDHRKWKISSEMLILNLRDELLNIYIKYIKLIDSNENINYKRLVLTQSKFKKILIFFFNRLFNKTISI